MLLPAALGAAIWEMVMHNRAFVHSGLAIYYYAAYTTYKIVNSILNFIKARKGDDMTVRALTILLGVIMIINARKELKKLSAAEGEGADSTQSR